MRSPKEDDMEWPFKSLKQSSTWPMQPFVIQLAAAVLHTPPPMRKKAAAKVIERCVRMGARLAVEFDMPAVLFVEVAKAQIAREGGPEAKAALAEAFGEEIVNAIDGAQDAVDEVQAQVAAIFSGEDTPEA
jgi:hypothetical protein